MTKVKFSNAPRGSIIEGSAILSARTRSAARTYEHCAHARMPRLRIAPHRVGTGIVGRGLFTHSYGLTSVEVGTESSASHFWLDSTGTVTTAFPNATLYWKLG